jgi:peptidyl-Lys metalloendopeptidase
MKLQIRIAAAHAQAYTSNALSYLLDVPRGRTRYTTWFGVYTGSRKDTVMSHFQSMNDTLISSFIYDCDCTRASYTYICVYIFQL